MIFHESSLRTIFPIFLSSGDDASSLRDRVTKLVNESVNPSLLDGEAGFMFEIQRWEYTPAQRSGSDGTNAQFVNRASSSALTIALLKDALGPGTQEEIEGVLDAKAELSALWFVARDDLRETQVSEYLRAKREILLYTKTGTEDSEESWHGIVRVLVAAVAAGYAG